GGWGQGAGRRHGMKFEPLARGRAGRGRAWPGPAVVPAVTAPALRPLARLLAQQLQQRLDLAVVALDDRGEFLALGHRHRDALDDDVDDLVALAALADAPVDLDRRAPPAPPHPPPPPPHPPPPSP